MPDVVEFLPERASREEWVLYHAFRRQQQSEWRPEEPVAPDQVEETMMRFPDERQFHHRWRVTLGGEMVSLLEAEAPRPESPEYETNRHLLWAMAYVLASRRRQGLGRAWLPKVLELMDEHGATVLSSMAQDEPGHAFLRGLGAEPKLTERQSRLDLGQVDWDMVDRWVGEGAERSPATRIELYSGRVPDDRLEEYCAALTRLLNTMPWEEMDHGDIVVTADNTLRWYERMDATGSQLHTYVVRERDGSISGMTDVLKHPHEPGLVRQMFTGVDPSARGRRLGKWLKAAMLRHVRAAHPDTLWIVTENAGSNAPMLAINHALGFRLYRTVTYYQIDRDTLSRAV